MELMDFRLFVVLILDMANADDGECRDWEVARYDPDSATPRNCCENEEATLSDKLRRLVYPTVWDKLVCPTLWG